jgi:hypothetical protein
MYLCLNCYKAYRNNKCKTCVNKAVEVDELLIPTITVLNKKGYKTKYCCSGHLTKKDNNCYIFFEESVTLPYAPRGYTYENGYNLFTAKYSGTEHYWKSNIIRKYFRGSINKSTLLYNAIKLLNWAESLPTLKTGVK